MSSAIDKYCLFWAEGDKTQKQDSFFPLPISWSSHFLKVLFPVY